MYNSKTLRTPELFVDDHHGQYMGKLAYESLNPFYKKQADAALSEFNKKAILDTYNEWHHEACDAFTRIDFKTPTGQKFNIEYGEGGMWLIPHCFRRTKAAAEFFGC